jgi:hypothetical protein
MRFSRGPLASALVAVVAGGTALVPFAASAQAAPITDLQGSLLSVSAPATTGMATYHASRVTSARELKVDLKNLPIQDSSRVAIFVGGAYVASARPSGAGAVHIDLTEGVPAMQIGTKVQVRTATGVGSNSGTSGKLICAGSLHLSPSTGSPTPTPGR